MEGQGVGYGAGWVFHQSNLFCHGQIAASTDLYIFIHDDDDDAELFLAFCQVLCCILNIITRRPFFHLLHNHQK